MKLHLRCGGYYTDDYKNIDLSKKGYFAKTKSKVDLFTRFCSNIKQHIVN